MSLRNNINSLWLLFGSNNCVKLSSRKLNWENTKHFLEKKFELCDESFWINEPILILPF